MSDLFAPKKNKFNASRVDRNGFSHGFASKLECSVYHWLLLREQNGEISKLLQQQTERLSAAEISYRADFSYWDNKAKEKVWVEAKGKDGEGWLIKKKLWGTYGPGRLEIFKGNYRSPGVSEVLEPKHQGLVCPGCGSIVGVR